MSRGSILVLIACLLALPGPRLSAGQKEANAALERVSILVHLTPGADRGPVRAFAVNRGGIVRYEYDILPNVINLRGIPRTALDALARIPSVTRLEEDKQVHAHLHDSTPLIRALQSQITGAGFSADGLGVRVCINDTGIDSDHIMYKDRIDLTAGRDFVNGDNDPEDDNGHGAHVAGITVGGTGLSVNFGCPASEPFQGIAPEATLIGVKVLNAGGSGSFSNVIAGIDYCADQSPSGGRADIINMSLGGGAFTGTCDSNSAAAAANAAVDAGLVVVASSGNDGNTNAMGTPACGSKVIAVGATYDQDFPNCEDSTNQFVWCLDSSCFSTCTDTGPQVDDLVCFSNQSDNLDVTAPGCVIWSASTHPDSNRITIKCGTSMSSPQVAGLAALLLTADPTLTPAQVRQIIRDGAIDFGPVGFDRGYGHGRIDVINSLSLVTPCTTDADCVDGLFCNGAETCDVISGTCQLGSDPCSGQDCNEVTDVCVPLVCNDNSVCEAGEDCLNCPGDCFSGTGAECGNGVCEADDGEDCVSCAQDCNGKQTGKPSGRYCCGDGDGKNPLFCSDPICTSSGFQCTGTPATPSCCGDTVCEGTEDSFNCEIDCGPPPICGDGPCDPGEDQCNCPEDCGAPVTENCTDGVDNDCDGLIDCEDDFCSSNAACMCGAKDDECSSNSDCCSNKCKGKVGQKSCK